jgi:hypothetical protein
MGWQAMKNERTNKKPGADIMSHRDDVLQPVPESAPGDGSCVVENSNQGLPTSGYGEPERTEQWERETERRIASHDRGELSANDDCETIERIRKQLADFRARKVAS